MKTFPTFLEIKKMKPKKFSDLNLNLSGDLEYYVFGLSKFQLRHSQISEDDYVFKALQNKNCAYFIKTLLEVSTNQVDISFLSNPNELSILSQTTENLHICKVYYNSIYHNIAGCFQEYLIRLPNLFVEKMEDDININLFSNIELKNEQDPAEIFKTFDTFNENDNFLKKFKLLHKNFFLSPSKIRRSQCIAKKKLQ